MDKPVKKHRNSSVELLRIFALFSIVLTHTIGGGKNLSGINMYFGLFANTFFNAGTGVVILMLITGYFGAHLTQKRFNNAYSIIYICSLFWLVLDIVFKTATMKSIIFSFIPVTTNFLWYASCYIYTLLLSPFLDKAADAMSKKTYQAFIGLTLVLFYLVPTFLYFDIAGNKGKGLVHMVLAYFIGRYLKKYPPEITKKTALLIAGGTYIFAFAGNLAATVVRHGVLSYPFSRDCTATTLIEAAALLIAATKTEFTLKGVNFFSSKIFYIFLLEPHDLVRPFFDVNDHAQTPLYILLIFGFTVLEIALAFGIAELLQFPAMLIEKVMQLVEDAALKIYNKSKIRAKIEKL